MQWQRERVMELQVNDWKHKENSTFSTILFISNKFIVVKVTFTENIKAAHLGWYNKFVTILKSKS